MMMPGQVRFEKWITREMLRANRDTYFVFGDNMQGMGWGGQAKEMRGERNAIGVPTKWAPGRTLRDYFKDEDAKNRDVWHAIRAAFTGIQAQLVAGRDVVFPADGLGSGLAELPKRAPKIDAMIKDLIAQTVALAEREP